MSELRCPKCVKTEACGAYHLYVIELALEVAEEQKFSRANPDYIVGKKCFYVGSTKHMVNCRFHQHKRFANPDIVDFPCDCIAEPTKRYFLGRHPEGNTRGNKFVGKYGLYLCPELFEQENPFETRAQVEDREVSYALEFRSKVFGVWQN